MNASIEPELQATPPRRIARRPGYVAARGNGCVALFLLPHALVGIGAFFLALFHLAVLIFGTNVPGTLNNTSTHRGSKGSVTYNATFQYQLGGVSYTSTKSITRKDYGAASIGQPINVRVLASMPGTGETLFIPGGSRFGTDFALFPFAFFWNGFMILFFWALFGSVWKEKSLVKSGVPALGRILEKETVQGKTTTYLVHYEFTPSAAPATGNAGSIGPWASSNAVQSVPAIDSSTGAPLRAKMTVPKPFYDVTPEGTEMTVLYDPQKPKRSILYQAAGYVASL